MQIKTQYFSPFDYIDTEDLHHLPNQGLCTNNDLQHIPWQMLKQTINRKFLR